MTAIQLFRSPAAHMTSRQYVLFDNSMEAYSITLCPPSGMFYANSLLEGFLMKWLSKANGLRELVDISLAGMVPDSWDTATWSSA